MKKILLVESARDFLTLEKSFLSRANIKLFTARDGKEAVELYKMELPDMIVLESELTDMGGYKLCQEIFAFKKCPVLVVFRKENEKDLNRYKEIGINNFIFRPLNQKEFLRRVGDILNIPQREDFRILMKVRVEGKREGNFFMGSTIDISTSGVLIETHNKGIDVGDLLECNFFLPWKLKAVNIHGEVTRKVEGAESCKYGIRFQRLDSSLKDEIRDYIKKKQKIAEQ